MGLKALPALLVSQSESYWARGEGGEREGVEKVGEGKDGGGGEGEGEAVIRRGRGESRLEKRGTLEETSGE